MPSEQGDKTVALVIQQGPVSSKLSYAGSKEQQQVQQGAEGTHSTRFYYTAELHCELGPITFSEGWLSAEKPLTRICSARSKGL